jgi:GMP synthase (glutamine-hydrolysing)
MSFGPTRANPVPAGLSGSTALLVIGGPLSATRDDGFPTRAAELALSRRAIDQDLPNCLGAQLPALAAGARVCRGNGPELGWAPIELRPEAGTGPPLAGALPQLTVLHWHGDTYNLPPGAVALARSSSYDQSDSPRSVKTGFPGVDHLFPPS